MPGPRRSLVACVVLSAACAGRVAAQTPQHPNVLVIVSDDQGWADIGYDNPRVWSPRLDALAAAGARFVQQYAMPQCTPTRAALLTGRYPSRFGPVAQEATNDPALPDGAWTLARMFATSGYATFLCGKWHLGPDGAHGPNAFGFAHSYGSFGGAVGMYDHRYRRGAFADTWQRDGVLIAGSENGTHATDLVAAEAVRFLEAKRDRPFFLYLAFHAVHTPLDERGRFVDEPTRLDAEHPDRWRHEDDIEWFHDPEGRIQREHDPEKRLLLAAVHHLDSAVGRVLDALDRQGLRDDTLLVFTSDNGPQVDWPGNAYPDDLKLTDFNQPLPMRGRKCDVYEGGIHVPAFAVWPGHIAPHAVTVPVHVIDWAPTFAALLGYRPAADTKWDGVDLGPVLFAAPDTEAALPERDLYWVWSRDSNRWALRHGDWKIVHYGKDEPMAPTAWQLFDLAADPREQRDVAATHADVVKDLHARFLVQRAGDRR